MGWLAQGGIQDDILPYGSSAKAAEFYGWWINNVQPGSGPTQTGVGVAAGGTTGGVISKAEAGSPGQAMCQELAPRCGPRWDAPRLLQQSP